MIKQTVEVWTYFRIRKEGSELSPFTSFQKQDRCRPSCFESVHQSLDFEVVVITVRRKRYQVEIPYGRQIWELE